MSTPEERPRFSVIIPARNEKKYVDAAIASVKAQDFAKPFEILVVDNGSADSTAKVAARVGAQVVSEPQPGLLPAREAGRVAAHGELLLYIDADMRLPADYLAHIDRAFQTHPQAVAVTNPFRFYDGTLLQRFILGFFIRATYPVQSLLLRLLGKPRQILGGNFTIKADAAANMGGFDKQFLHTLGEDLNTTKRLAPFGKVIYLPRLYSTTSARRFAARGSLRTASSYVRSFFATLLSNKKPSSVKGLFPLPVLALLMFLAINFYAGHFIDTHWFFSITILAILLLAGFVYGLVSPRSELFGPVTNTLNTNEKIVALTFDDGPRPGSTEQVLKILAEKAVPATFFVIGKNVDKYPQLVRRTVDAGHELGNHSLNHSFTLPFLSAKSFLEGIEHTEQSIEKVTGRSLTPKLYRPPHGWRSPWTLAALMRAGYQVITWDVWLDYVPHVSAHTIKKRYLKKTKPGSILLFHDAIWENPADERSNMLAALPEIIDELKARGYRFARLSELL